MIQGKNNDQIKPFYLVKNKRMSFDFPDVSDSLKNRQNPVIKLNKMVKALKRKIV